MGGAQLKKSVVLDAATRRAVPQTPKIVSDEASDLREFAEKPSRQIDQVNSLVEKFSSACKIRRVTPFLFVSGTPAVAVSRDQVHGLTDFSVQEQLARPRDPPVMPQSETHHEF